MSIETVEISIETIEKSLRIGDKIEFSSIALNLLSKQQFEVYAVRTAKLAEGINHIFYLKNKQEVITISFELSTEYVAISREISNDEARQALAGQTIKNMEQWMDTAYESTPKIIEGIMYADDLRDQGPHCAGQHFIYECYQGQSGGLLLDVESFEQETRTYLTALISAHEAIAQIIALR